MKFAQPQVLWVLLAVLPALIGFLCWSWRVKQKLVLQFVRARLLPSLTAGVSAARQKVRLALLVAAVAGVLLALARPQWGFAWEEAKQQGLDIIVAIDTSRSMLAQDVAPNRLNKAKLAIIDLMRLAKTDRLGLVAFAGSAFLQAPLTLDEAAFQEAVDAVSVGIIPQGGTALAEAIRTALAAFEKGNDNHKVLVLFTDGEDHDAEAETMAAAKEAAQAGLRIFTIGVGTPEGELLRVPDEQGNPVFVKDDDDNAVKSRLNQTLLQQIATEAGGFYLPLQGANPMETLYARGLAPLPKTEETTRLARVYRERYHWPLGFAVLCLVIEVLLPESPRSRRTDVAPAGAALPQTAALLVLLLAAPAAHGSPSRAFRDFQSGNFEDSFDEYNRLSQQKTNDYRLHYDAGAAAYKAKKLDSALDQFNAALNSADIVADPQSQQHAYFNLGNTLFRLGEPLPDPEKKKQCWQQSVESFIRALRLDTNDLDAKNNLAYVKHKLEELKQQQQQQKKDQNQDQKDQDQKDRQQQQNQDKKKDQNQQQPSSQQDQKKDQPQENKSGQQKKDEEKARQEQAGKDQEKPQQQARQGDQNDKGQENGEPAAVAEARMTPQEARQLLEAQKDDEKVLIFAPENQPVKNRTGRIKDW
ncbi:MAG: VWA domain-containing protein [Verrucomicrobiota bacterium]|jgi:Ca-activated chloride channel family protein